VRLSVRAPATVANLGPGFDCLALALDVANRFTVDTGAPPGVRVEGEGADELPHDPTNVVVRTMTFLAREMGGSLPTFGLLAQNDIPLQRGLGSSASAVVGGLLLADRLVGAGLSPERLLEMAVDLEGHPDNVAACLRGGLVLAHLSSKGWRAERLAVHDDLRPAVLVPLDERLSTEEARRVLPREVPLADAAFNLSRSALAVVALTGRPELLPEALEDRLHQPRRLPLVPASRALFEELRQADVPVCVCGSGPSLLAFETEGRRVWDLGPGWRVLRPAIDTEGARFVDAN
jgi:homoserine kinase